ncbi:MAG: hypothetical protein ACO24P_00720 [Candidatus Nanopelagicaceae bacterium]
MSQVFPDSPGVIYRILDADPEFSSYIGTYKFVNSETTQAISLLSPGSSVNGISSVTGVECIIHDISDIKRIDYLTDSSTLVNEWKVFLVAWDPATGEDVNNAARRIMEIFRGATSTQTVRTSEGLNARVQTVVTIPSSQPLDIDGMAIYGPQPTVTLTSNYNYIQPGGTIILTWEVFSSVRAEMNNGIGVIPLSGSLELDVDKTTNYIITAYNDFTSGTGGFEVVVLDPVVTMFEYSRIGTTDQYNITWGAANAQEVRFNGRYDWPLSGNTNVTVTQPTEFILEAYSTQGTDTASITITP